MTESDVITSFYTAFANHDAEGMIELYHDEIEFHDPAFGSLKGDRAKSMWKMLLGQAKGNLKVAFRDVSASGGKAKAHWTASYEYGAKKRKVVNEIDAIMDIENGKIVKHVDHFDIWKWSSMALGVPGTLLGWTPFIKSKIRKQANTSLDKYITKEKA